MPKTKSVPIQVSNPDGSISIISKKQLSLSYFLDQLEKKRDSKNKIETLGFFNNILINLYEIDGEKWILLTDLTKMLGESRQASWIRFNRLIQEWEPYSRTYFLDKYRKISREDFLLKFPSQHSVD